MLVGFVRVVIGQKLPTVVWHTGHIAVGTHAGGGLLLGASVFVFLKAFANGGSSMTGLEAISNGVGALRPPEGRHARRLLTLQGCTLGVLVLGVTLLAHWTRAIPYVHGWPTVVSQEVRAVFGQGLVGSAPYYYVLFASVLILWTGGNTSFNGFPFLASFVAGDAFLPRMLTKRGHRLSFSNGIIALGVLAMALLVVTKANLDALIGVYAIGVFTGFTFAGAGLARYHIRHKGPGWHHKFVINCAAALCSFAVVLIFLVTKFTEGAWAVFVIFLVGVPAFVRLNREYREEEQILGSGTALLAARETSALRRHVAFVLVDRVDVATGRAVQYARTLNVDVLRAVHFVVDVDRARVLQEGWRRLGLSGMPLELVECPDRRVAVGLRRARPRGGSGRRDRGVASAAAAPAYSRLASRFLHDQTAERIAAAVSRLPHVNATIIPFDVKAALEARRRRLRGPGAVPSGPVGLVGPAGKGGHGGHGGHAGHGVNDGHGHGQGAENGEAEPPGTQAGLAAEGLAAPAPPPGCVTVSRVQPRQHAKVVGRVRSMVIKPWGTAPTLECTITDGTGRLVVAFMGRREVAGLEPGTRIMVEGTAALRRGQLVMINPAYELLTSSLQA